MGIPLVISDKELGALRGYAEAHKIPIQEIRMMADGKATLVGERDGHVLIPGYDPDPKKNADFGWKVAYSIEEHPLRDGDGTMWVRHMSMSSAIEGREPNLFSLGLVAEGLGFPPLDQCQVQMNPVDGFIEVLAEYKT